MAQNQTQLDIEARVKGLSGLNQLKSSLRRIGLEAKNSTNDLKGMAQEIIKHARATGNSINSIKTQRDAFDALRRSVDITSDEFKQATLEVARLDKQLAKIEGRKPAGGRGGLRGAAQVVGTVAGAGVFGGVEGAAGAALGGIAGGAEGAIVGGALGAQVGMLRQQIGEFAEYAAGIQKLEIALREAAGSEEEFAKAVAGARRGVEELNVPQEVATRSMTRLTAAVKGAGGSVSDAALVFNNVTAAIKGTGGSAQDVDGAITALVQVFSKGKVSAEELSGQLGERLAGAVTRFADANNLSLQGLQDALKKGEVGLDELMQFIVKLGEDFSGVGRKISKSSQDAGARLQIAFNDMKIEVGSALQPIGAEFQNAFAGFITDITPALLSALPAIGNVALLAANNLDILAAAAATVGAALVAVKWAAITEALAAMLVKITAIVASVKALTLALATNPFFLIAAGAAAAAVAIGRAVTQNDRFNKSLTRGELTASEISDKQIELSKAVVDAQADVDTASKRGLSSARQRLVNAKKALQDFIDARAVLDKPATATDDEITKFGKVKSDDDPTGASKIATAMANADKFGAQLGRTLEDLQSRIAGVGETATEAISRRYADALRKADEKAADNIAKIIKLEQQSGKSYEEIRSDIEEVRLAARRLAEETALDAIGEEFAQALKDAQQPLNDLLSDFNSQIKERARIEELMSQGMSESLAKEIANIETIAGLEKEKLDAKILNLQTTIAELDPEKALTEEYKEQLRLLKEARDALPGRREEAIAGAKTLEKKEDSPGDIIAKGFEKARDNLEKLTNLGNIAVKSANMIGDAFGKAFTDIATGTMTVKEAVGNMLQSIGQSFIKMAAEIIAQQMKMILLGALVKAVGAAAGAGAGDGGASMSSTQYFNPQTGKGVAGPNFGLANGGAAKAGQAYLVGERGPELFMPSANGGVMRNEDMRRLMGRSPAGVGGGSTSMNFTFETTNIGGTEYVSREQLEAAMATTRRQAANDGAKRGMSMTLDKMQNSPRTRSRIGIS